MNMGGSLLPSEGHNTLKPVKIGKFSLQVLRVIEADTYLVGYTKEGSSFSTMAGHANGYSCHVIIERIVEFANNRMPAEKVAEQFDFILKCGGIGVSRETFLRTIDIIKKR